MASITTPSYRRIIPIAARLGQREPYGDADTMFEAGVDELASGHLENAWVAFHDAYCRALRQRFEAHSGRTRSPIYDPRALLYKMVSGRIIDRWFYKVALEATERPKLLTFRNVDIFGSIAHGICFD